MFTPRKTESKPVWSDPDMIKIYTISDQNQPVNQAPFLKRRCEVKELKALPWAITPVFTIFHEGASYPRKPQITNTGEVAGSAS